MWDDHYLWGLGVTDYYLPFPIVVYIRWILLAASSRHLLSSTNVKPKLAINHRSLRLSPRPSLVVTHCPLPSLVSTAVTRCPYPSVVTSCHLPSSTGLAITCSHSLASTASNCHLSSPPVIHSPCNPPMLPAIDCSSCYIPTILKHP